MAHSLTAIALRAEELMTDGGHHVDSGCHVLGMKRPEAPDISLSPGKE
jgi:hypothetical protein